jgi:hypothetical protein
MKRRFGLLLDICFGIILHCNSSNSYHLIIQFSAVKIIPSLLPGKDALRLDMDRLHFIALGSSTMHLKGGQENMYSFKFPLALIVGLDRYSA